MPSTSTLTFRACLVTAALALCGVAACSGAGHEAPDAARGDAGDAGQRDDAGEIGETGPLGRSSLRISEVCAQDDGFLIDELGQTEDWIEVANVGDAPVELSDYALVDDGAKAHPLASGALAPGEAKVFFADAQPEQGARHLTFRLADEGERVRLLDLPHARIADEVTYPALTINETYGRYPGDEGPFARCRYASPGKPNGATCGPPPPPALPKDFTFQPYTLPTPWPALPTPLAITEVALRPARFVEVMNTSDAPVTLADFTLRVSATGPGDPWPLAADGVALAWPKATLQPHENLAVSVAEANVADIAAGADYEGVVTLFGARDHAVRDRVELERPPTNGALARFPAGVAGAPGASFAACANTTPAAANDTCVPVAVVDVGDRLRRLSSLAEESALAAGGTDGDSQSVKFVVDMQAGDAVHFLSNRDWALHYTWIRDKIDHEPALDRCSAADAAIFDAGWLAFSQKEYFKVDGRRFLLGTLVRYGASGAKTIEFARGDVITGPLMKRAFLDVLARVADPTGWALRPQDPGQVAAARVVDGQLPIVDPNAPFRGQTFQPVATAVAFGFLHFVAGADLSTEALGPDTIVVTDEVPNDLALVGGIITEVFQTPLSHVGILSKNRGTPDMALVDARHDPRLAPFLEKLVRLEVTGSGFTVREAMPAEAQAFWRTQRPQGPPVSPRLDTSVRGLVDLIGHGLEDLPSIGAKAAQLAEVMRIDSHDPSCLGAVPTPPGGFAVPVVHSLEHFVASGAADLLARWRAMPTFAVDPRVRAQGLAEVRAAILAHPVEPALVSSIEAIASARFGTARFRMRSSSNTEDLQGFSGAGLYTSISGAIGDPKHRVEDGLRTVWASLWEPRAFDERELALIDHSKTAMGVLVHDAYAQVERANGVAVSRDVLDPTEAKVFSIDAQAGEASVTNPAAGVASDQLVYNPYYNPPATYRARSSLADGPVLTVFEMGRLTCFLGQIRDHFQAVLDPDGKSRWFTMEVEFKFVGDTRDLVIKQARPYSFGSTEIPADCREH
ncbi:MAG: hypothetical protein JWM82_1596 [Myxococcales bacterium]|nr:hypothetical protein [Myxococcales bacterium]